jgi:ArsR family transcriptional regulator
MAGKGFNMELFFAALADRTRLRLLSLMAGGEICVCFLVEVLGTNQPKISRHLAYLRRAGLVSDRKEGKWVHYGLAEPSEPNAARILREVLAWLKDDPEMRRDRERLMKVCCSPQPPVAIQGAPRPAGLSAP